MQNSSLLPWLLGGEILPLSLLPGRDLPWKVSVEQGIICSGPPT